MGTYPQKHRLYDISKINKTNALLSVYWINTTHEERSLIIGLKNTQKQTNYGTLSISFTDKITYCNYGTKK